MQEKSKENVDANDELECGGSTGACGRDAALYEDAVAFVKAAGCASAARLQRGLGIGYSHAARLIELLERNGVIGPKREGHVLREVLDR